MVITRLKGGLGNQMFQYAAGKALAAQHQTKLQIDLSFLKQNPNTKGVFIAREYELHNFDQIRDEVFEFENLYENRLVRKFKSFFRKKEVSRFFEKSMAFDPDFFKVQPPVLLDGYWQSEKYFNTHEQVIRKAFTFPHLSAIDKNLEVLTEIKAVNAISLHVRRGDYLNKLILEFHGICTLNYYDESIAFMKAKYPDATFFFFSDDTAWVKQELVLLTDKYRIVEGNSGADSWKDMFLMSSCKHHIIANSSFSWWGAWLNSNPEKTVIAPKQWFKVLNEKYNTMDLLPPGWMQL